MIAAIVCFVAAFAGALLGAAGITPRDLYYFGLYLWDRIRGRA